MSQTNKILCPACNKPMSPKGTAKHTGACPKWAEVIGVPSREFNFDKHYGRKLYATGLVEGVDFTRCKICLRKGKDVRQKRLMDHLKKVHQTTEAEYTAKFPGAIVRIPRTAQKRRQTVQDRYGVDNVFQADETKQRARETSLERYGVEHASRAPEVVAKRDRTNLERYGHVNPFGSAEVQGRIRETWRGNYGVDNPNQSPEVMARRIATNQERYGVDHYLQAESFADKFRGTSQQNWGADHPMQSEEGRKACTEKIQEAHGVDFPFQSAAVQKRGYETNLANHGGQHSQKSPEVLAKARATWMEKYGFDNPAKVEAVKERVKATWMRNYGVPFPPQSMWMNRTMSFPNKLEQRVDALSPEVLVYAGDGSYWVKHKGASKTRNPDFVVLTREQLALYQAGADLNDLRTYRIVEIFGDYWHGPKFTGMSRAAHKVDVLDYYTRCGISCLIIWEHEVKKHPKRVAERIRSFVWPLVQ